MPVPLPFPRRTAAGSRQPLGLDESQPLLSRVWKSPPALTGDRRHASSVSSEKKMSTVIFNDEYLTLSAHRLTHAPHKSYFPIQAPISSYTTFQPQFSKCFTWQSHHFPTSQMWKRLLCAAWASSAGEPPRHVQNFGQENVLHLSFVTL